MEPLAYTVTVCIAAIAATLPIALNLVLTVRLFRKRKRVRMRYYTEDGAKHSTRVNPYDLDSVRHFLELSRKRPQRPAQRKSEPQAVEGSV